MARYVPSIALSEQNTSNPVMNANIQRFFLTILFTLTLAASASANTPSVSSADVQTPNNLRVAVYSPRVAELFWDRATNPLTQYDVFRNGNLVQEGQFGISYFDATLQPSQPYTYTVVAINEAGQRSDPASISIGMPDEETQPSSVPVPKGLRASVYSSNVAELFWERADDPFTRYDIFRNGELVKAGQFGISYFDPEFNSSGTTEYSVVAIDAQDNRSDAASIKLGSPVALVQPEDLSITVYSTSAAELFWNRQGPGQLFVIERDGIEIYRTDGISYFDNSLPGEGVYNYEVFAIDSSGGRSTPATVVGLVGDTSQPTTGTEALITLDTAVELLKNLWPIANASVFEPMVNNAETASRKLEAAAFASLADFPAPANGVTLIPGSDGGPSELSTVGRNGGRYTCDAGGTGAVPLFRAFERGTGFIVTLDNCVLESAIYSGQYRFVGAVPRSGNLGSDQLLDWQADANNGSRYRVQQFDKQGTTQFFDRSQSTRKVSVTDFQSFIDGQTTTIANLETTRIRRFGRSLEFDRPDEDVAPVEKDFAEESLSAAFEVAADFSSQQRIDVLITLSYDYGGIIDPVLRWQSGEISARAEDGSEFRAIPMVSGNAASVRVIVEDGFVDVPYDEIF